MSASVMTALLGAAAFSVDLGSLYLKKRELQGAVDLAAIAAAQDIGNADFAAKQQMKNRYPDLEINTSTQLGTYVSDQKIDPAKRFTTGGPSNAVHVEAQMTAPLFFAAVLAGRTTTTISRQATAARAQMASFQIGTRLASVQGGVANGVLGALTGSSVSLSVMDYNALASADVDLLSYMSALQTRLSLKGMSFNKTLEGTIETNTALQAIVDVLAATNQSAAASAMGQLAVAANHAPKLRVGDLLNLGVYGAQDSSRALESRKIAVNALDLATAALETANGARQLQVDLGATVPGIANTTLYLAIGQRPTTSPWLTVTDKAQPVIHTAQMRAYLVAQIAVSGLSGVASVKLPVLIEAASADARMSAIHCAMPLANSSVTIDAAPSLGSLTIGEIPTGSLSDFTKPLVPTSAKLVSTLLLKVEGSANAKLGGNQSKSLTFYASDIESGTIKTVSTTDIAQASVATLIGNMNLTVSALGLGVNLGNVTAIVKPALTAAAPELDKLANGLTDLLGLRLGQADVRVNGLRCYGAALVQ